MVMHTCKWCDQVLERTKGGGIVCPHCDRLCDTGPSDQINVVGCVRCARLARRHGY